MKKTITDLQNKYRSKLKEAQQPKLTKVLNHELIIELRSKIEVLQELLEKL